MYQQLRTRIMRPSNANNPHAMNTLARSSFLKQLLIFSGLLGAVLALNALNVDLASAAAISPDDSPDIVRNLTGGEGSLRDLILTILNYFLGFLGVFTVIMVIYGGFLYVSSAGNEENATKGKTVIMYAAIGLLLIMISFALVNTILGSGGTSGATGAGTTTTTTTIN